MAIPLRSLWGRLGSRTSLARRILGSDFRSSDLYFQYLSGIPRIAFFVAASAALFAFRSLGAGSWIRYTDCPFHPRAFARNAGSPLVRNESTPVFSATVLLVFRVVSAIEPIGISRYCTVGKTRLDRTCGVVFGCELNRCYGIPPYASSHRRATRHRTCR